MCVKEHKETFKFSMRMILSPFLHTTSNNYVKGKYGVPPSQIDEAHLYGMWKLRICWMMFSYRILMIAPTGLTYNRTEENGMYSGERLHKENFRMFADRRYLFYILCMVSRSSFNWIKFLFLSAT